jgi:hypothetical protein
MTQTADTVKILGKWKLSVDTPFGKEQYSLSVESIDGELAGFVFHEKGTASLVNLSFVNQTFKCSLHVEFPIKAIVNLKANVMDNNKMFGTLQVDQYLKTLFIGER